MIRRLPSLGDAFPFIIIAVIALSAVPFPKLIAGVDAIWFLFVTIGMTRTTLQTAPKDRKGYSALWFVFNIPTAIIALIVWLRW